MKTIKLLLTFLLFTSLVHAQSAAQNACNQAAGFCTGTNYNFPNNTGVSSYGGGGKYGCLSTTPNPVWYYLQVDQSGTIIINISQTNANTGATIDVDYAVWGPFNTLADACAGYSGSNIVSCSYSASGTETATITNAQAGKIYLMLLTNYSNQNGNITFSQGNASNANAGSTNCDVLCNITGGTAVPGACDPVTNTHPVSGTITTFAPPTSGTLTISSSCGTATQTFNAPFGTSQAYTLAGINSTGGSCTVTAVYSADPTCTRTITYTSPANCLPTCPVTATNTGPYCEGAMIQLNAAGTGQSFSWTGPNGFTSTLQNPTIPAANATTIGAYVVTIVDGTCTSTGTTTVALNTSSITVTPATSTICSQEPTNLTVAITPSAATYTWTTTGTNVSGNTNGSSPFAQQTLTTTATIDGQLSYTFTPSLNGCLGTPVTVNVNVGAKPVIFAGPDQQICAGETVTLNGSGALSLAWNNNVTNNVAFSPTTTNDYILTGTSNLGCTSTDTVKVTVVNNPIVDIMADIYEGCGPLAVKFVSLNAQGFNHQWNFGNGQTSNQNDSTSTVYTNAGIYNVTLTLSNTQGCSTTRVFDAFIEVYPNPQAEFSPNPKVLDQQNSSSQMTNLSSGATSYTWDFGDGSLNSNATNPSHVFPTVTAGNYTIMLTAVSAYGCVDTARVNIVVKDDIIYYIPNAFTPDEDEFNPTFKPIFTTGFDPHDYSLTIFNRWGEMVFQSFDVHLGWDGTFTYSKGRIQDGSYTWKIEFKTTSSDARKVLMGNVTLIK